MNAEAFIDASRREERWLMSVRVAIFSCDGTNSLRVL